MKTSNPSPAAPRFCIVVSLFLVLLPFEAFANQAELVSIQGTGEHRLLNSDPWLPAKVSQVIAPGGFVRTGTLSKMGVLFSDQTQIRLNQNSVLQIQSIASMAGSENQQVTRVRLDSGRAWSQTKRLSGSSLYFDTPAATAAIRGTDWDIEVDGSGATLMTVFSGSVEFYNELGSLTLVKDQAALALPGKAPVRLLLSNPRDRIQWVNALTVDSQRVLGPLAADAVWQAVVDAFDSGNLEAVRLALQSSGQQGTVPYALLSSDLALVQGEFDQALNGLNEGLSIHSNHPRLLAAKSRVELLADRLSASQASLNVPNLDQDADLLLAKADLLRRQGLASEALLVYQTALALRPEEDRAAAGSGAIFSEREHSQPARADLNKAIALRPDIAAYKGELGTLETFANQFPEAEKAYTDALVQNPSDYVSLTGLGLLRLKQGRRQDALDCFLKAGLMAPEYARAKTYTAVAYYQMGRRQDAIGTLLQVIEIDDKDPIPYIFLSQIYTDLFEPELAVQASRSAVERMPYLKSANQLANDQKGNSNLGTALAFFGLEEWALELAQQSAYPYWGGSHLFLSDRYPGEFNKNSELFQGFLTDPLAFGSSPTFSSLLRQPGDFGILGIQRKQDLIEGYIPSVTVNGLNSEGMPSAYFFKYNLGKGEFPFRNFVSNNPPEPIGLSVSDLGLDVWTLGLGLQPSADSGVFLYYNRFQTTFDD
ncbi:MAG: FecR domain-containing protein [Limnobacter sp.]|nr:FecR domain-containing protein [Limnobacter sp.]